MSATGPTGTAPLSAPVKPPSRPDENLRIEPRIQGARLTVRSIEPVVIGSILGYTGLLLGLGLIPFGSAQLGAGAVLIGAFLLSLYELRRVDHPWEISLRVARGVALALCAPSFALTSSSLPWPWLWILAVASVYPCGLSRPLAFLLVVALAAFEELVTLNLSGVLNPPDVVARLAALLAVGYVSYAWGQALDTLERAQRSKRLRQQRADIIVAYSDIVMVFADRSYQLVHVNDAVKRALGYPTQQVRKLWSLELVHPDDRAGFLAQRHVLLARPGESSTSRLRVRHMDGHWVVFELRVTNLLQHPAVRGFFASAIDISARVMAEQELRNERTILRAMLDHLPLSVYTKDLQGKYLMSNRANVERLGQISERAMVGRTALELDRGNRMPSFDRDDERVLQNGEESVDQEFRFGAAGNARWYQVTKLPLADVRGTLIGMLGMVREITESRAAQALLLHHATHDALTGLFNRRYLSEKLANLMADPQARRQPLALLFCDLDLFKTINDRYGHEVGDQFLSALGERLEPYGRAEGRVLARFGGDEFVLMAPLGADESARGLAESVLATIAAPVVLGELSLQADVSIGVAELDEEHSRPEDLIRDADTAMYLAKSEGRNRIAVFDDALRRRSSRDSGLAQALRGALERSELHLLYQPKVDLRTGLVAGFEALLRWESEKFGPVSPNEFIPLAEESGLIVPLGLWALRQACLQLRRWQERHPKLDHLTIAVNVSMRQLAQESFLSDVVGIIEDSQIYPTALELELTESASMQDPELAVDLLGRLKDRGVRLALDDFGTGYSSLAHLRRLPVDVLKIDRAFVHGLESASDDSEIVRLVIALARALRIQCVAEGIETQANASEIRRLGCDLGQGHYFSKALPVAEAGALLELNPAYFVG